MPGATWRSRPHAAWAASAARFGSRAVSSSERPVSGRGSPPSPSSESSTIFVVFGTTNGATRSSIAQASFTGFSSRPRPVISMRTTSPGWSQTGGFFAKPQPGGVPVAMRSPGASVMSPER